MSIDRYGVQARMSQAVVYNGVGYLSGQVSDKPEYKNVKEQTVEVLQKLEKLMAEVGSDKTKVLMANIWLSDIASFNEMNAVWDEWVADGHAPSRATVEAKLATPNHKVEIAFVVAV